MVPGFTSDNVELSTSDNQNAGERVHLTYPNGGEVIEGGAPILIAWTQDPAILVVTIESSLDLPRAQQDSVEACNVAGCRIARWPAASCLPGVSVGA